MIPRSYLYVPGNDQSKLDKALSRGADALIIDLEDAVPVSGKETAREAVACWLGEQRPREERNVEIWVRVNPGDLGHEDIRAVVGPAVTGVMVAKAASAEELEVVDTVLTEAESATGVTTGTIGVVPLLESAAAVLQAERIAAAPRVVRLQVGEEDLAADTGIAPGADQRELAAIRSRVVLVSAAAGLMSPVAPVSTDFRDLEAFRASTTALARQGFVGRACIHPAQIDVANDVFTPDERTVAASRELVASYEDAVSQGKGVLIGADGKMIDEAVVRRARRVLALAR